MLIGNSPRVLQPGETYILKVFGVPCPRAVYTNANEQFVNERIFIGIYDSNTSQVYS
jgi:hypothetical protein